MNDNDPRKFTVKVPDVIFLNTFNSVRRLHEGEREQELL